MRSLLTTALLAIATTAFTQVSETMQHGGITRSYVLYVPTSYVPGQHPPLVFVLHGTLQDGTRIMDISAFNTVAESNGFVAVYPDGIGNSWNTGVAGGSTADDMGYIDTLATVLIQQYGIDTTRIYSCGFSAGGYMSHRLACESTRCFAAIASVSGTMTTAAYAACVPAFNTPVMQMHGTNDPVVNYNGSGISGESVDNVIALWAGADACATPPVITALPNINLFDFSTVEQQVYAPCDDNAQVVLLKVIGGGHQWPGTSDLFGGIGIINQDIDATQVIWDFFNLFTCANLSTPVVAADPTDAAPVVYSEGGALIVQWKSAPVTYAIIDALGAIVKSGTLVKDRNVIGIQSLASGAYVLRLLEGKSHGARFNISR